MTKGGAFPRIAGLFVLLHVVSACSKSAPPPAVVLAVRGEPAPRVERAATQAEVGVDLRVVHAPAASAAAAPAGRLSASAVEERLASARADYVSGELSRVRSCAERLSEPELVWSSLARRSRIAAARVLVWRIACTSIARRDDAVEAARTFAALDLELPPEVEAIPVEAHRILASAMHDAETAEKRELAVGVTGQTGAEVVVDGRFACTSDCVVSVRAGDHLVEVNKDGFSPDSRTVRVAPAEKRTEAKLTLAAASPDLAAQQWATSYGAPNRRADANEAILLLAQSFRTRRFAYVEADPLAAGVRLRGALALDGKIEARAEKQGDVDGATRDVLRELLVKGGVVEDKSLVKRPLFWIAVGAVAILSSGVTAYLLYDPGSRTEVRTR